MEFGLDKGAVLGLERGRHGDNPVNNKLANSAIFRHLQPDKKGGNEMKTANT